jgi:transcription elongation factor Elf1
VVCGRTFGGGKIKNEIRGAYFAGVMETEKNFKCPFCGESISMILDLSVDDTQTYIEDCQVCCRPIQITFTAENGELRFFSSQGAL